ncbi:type II secretion system F family protein [Massilia sp. METH4]|uniref:type II secretion system F family protein n=1 Tax=Massilia sp. METH4 TaxID=3123041 RepID=UPI0030CE81A0
MTANERLHFTVRTFDAASGTVTTVAAEGEHADAVRAALEAQGNVVLDVLPVRARWTGLRARRQTIDAVLFCDELRTLLVSGMSLVEAIETLHDKEGPGYKRAVLGDLRGLLAEGKALSSALQLCRHPFSPLLVASIRASERSSGLEAALDEYIAYERVTRDLNRKLVTAAIYPVLVIAFGMLVCLFMLAYVVPRFARVYEDFSDSISLSTQLLIGVARFFDAHLGAVALGLAVGAALLVRGYLRGSLQTRVLGLLIRVRIIRHHVRLYQLARLYQTMAMLLRGGFTLNDAMPLAQNLALDDALRAQMDRARTRLAEGQRLSKAFDDCGLTDTVTLRLLQVGERSGNLSHVLGMIAQTYRNDFTLFIERATRVAEPVILMLVGLLIGALIILMYMPVFDLAGGL